MEIALVPNLIKPAAVAAAHELEVLLKPCAGVTILHDPSSEVLRQVRPDLVVVLGGDGSILHVASAIEAIDAPVLGINFGKLGYLAAFSMDEFRTHLDLILAGRAPVTARLMLEAAIFDNGAPSPSEPTEVLLTQTPMFRDRALNDVVINAGAPFKMIELHIRINHEETTTFRGDGIILGTASGSTGYNLSAGGPLIAPEVDAIVLTPICPHSLSFRPVVLASQAVVLIHPHKTNEGTSVTVDGRTTRSLSDGETLVIRRAPKPLRLVENPTLSHWQMLAHKLHWAQSPRQ